MCDESQIQNIISSGALNDQISSMVKENIADSDQINDALYKKGCSLIKDVFSNSDNKAAYTNAIVDILQTQIPQMFQDDAFKQNVTKALVNSIKTIDFKDYLIETSNSDVKTTIDGGAKLHNKTFKKGKNKKKSKRSNKNK
tara:strand:- start:94 stop:516 length:423 start_codon:yes stop_codon:yes gene_type:complete